jgi:hypothetical protein
MSTEHRSYCVRRRAVLHDGLVLKIERDLQSLGGIASTAELLRRGHSGDELLLWARHPRIIRVRKGWYALADLAPDAIRAWRVGGPLACVSAAVLVGAVPSDVNPLGILHVSVPSTAARLRAPSNHRERLGDHPVVVHWGGRRPPSRLAVPLDIAWRQMALCASEESRAAIGWRAANR